MAKAGKDFTQILIKKGILGPDQVSEAVSMQQTSGIKLADAIVRLGYASIDEVMTAMAEQFGMEYIHLEEVQIPNAVIQLVPESVARENVVLPLSQDNGALKIIMSDPMDFETVDKLRFILNRDIEIGRAHV